MVGLFDSIKGKDEEESEGGPLKTSRGPSSRGETPQKCTPPGLCVVACQFLGSCFFTT